MYLYCDFDRQVIRLRAAQYRDQLQRYLRGQLSDDDFRPLRLQNGWYVQRHAPMLRVAVPYGQINSRQLRVLARLAQEFDQPSAEVYRAACAQSSPSAPLATGVGHFTTRQNVQFNWIALERSADVMDLLASVDMHGIQTSGNCIRNITCDALAGVAPDELIDPRPYCEIIRQWSTLHPEFAYLPRKFKIAVTGAAEDRAATAWHDVGLHLHHDAEGQAGFRVLAGGGMGRTPILAGTLREFLPWHQILNYLEAILRVYNCWGRRDNQYKARLKILFKTLGQRFVDDVEAEYTSILQTDGALHTVTQAELDRVSASFADEMPDMPVNQSSFATNTIAIDPLVTDPSGYATWLAHNVRPHKNPDLRCVTLSFKRPGVAPGDAPAHSLQACADMADRFSAGLARITHQQNLVLPWVHQASLPALWQSACQAGLASANVGLITDVVACPGGDFCALAFARSTPIASAISRRFADCGILQDIGPVDLHISGCINSCGHHHSGHIGILGVDKDGREWYQVSLGGSDGRGPSGPATSGQVIGPSFAATEVADVVQAVVGIYLTHRTHGESLIHCVRRLGLPPFRQAADTARHETREGGPVLHIHGNCADAPTD